MNKDLRSNHSEPSALKRLHGISFAVKIAYLRTAFFTLPLQVCFCVGKTEKQQFQNIEIYFQTLVFNS